MRVMVTGGAGFIGSHTVDKLIDAGAEVLIVDNLSTGKEENINRKADFIRLDIESESLHDVFEKFRPEFVIHQAAQVSVPNSVKYPVHDCKNNILGTVNLLENCRKNGVKKVVYSSSAAVYGNPDTIKISEDNPVIPLSFYGVSKLTPEFYLNVFSHLYGLRYTVLRYANVYGPRQDALGEGGVISIFATKLLTGLSPVVFGDGEQTRDFIYVEDVAAANVKALSGADNMILNVGTGERISVNKLLSVMAEIINSGIKPVHADERQGDIKHSCMEIGRIKEYLGWEPDFSLAEGLAKTMEFYKNNSFDLLK